MISATLGAVRWVFAVINKLLPSREWLGGEASQRAENLEKKEEHRENVDGTPYPGSGDVSDRLHDGEF